MEKLTVLDLFQQINWNRDIDIVIDEEFLNNIYRKHEKIDGSLSQTHDLIPSSKPIHDTNRCQTLGNIVFSKTNPNISVRCVLNCEITVPENSVVGACSFKMEQFKSYPIIKNGQYVVQKIRLVSDVLDKFEPLFDLFDVPKDCYQYVESSEYAEELVFDLTAMELYPKLTIDEIRGNLIDYNTYSLCKKMYERALILPTKEKKETSNPLLDALESCGVITEDIDQETIDAILQYFKSIGITDRGYNPKSTVNESAAATTKEIKISIAKFSRIPKVTDVLKKQSDMKPLTDSEMLLWQFMTDEVSEEEKERDYRGLLESLSQMECRNNATVFNLTLNPEITENSITLDNTVGIYDKGMPIKIKCDIKR